MPSFSVTSTMPIGVRLTEASRETMIQYGTTAAAVGATVTPTGPKPELEPAASGPNGFSLPFRIKRRAEYTQGA
jgi:hypothetical protein